MLLIKCYRQHLQQVGKNRLWNNDEAMTHHLKNINKYIYINQIIVIIYTNINFK